MLSEFVIRIQVRHSWQINTGGEKTLESGPAAETGADWQKQQAWSIRRHGAGVAMRSGKTPVADQRLRNYIYELYVYT